MSDAKYCQHRGMLYHPDDPEVTAEQVQCQERLYDFNQTRPSESDKRTALLKEMFAEIGEGCYIEPPLHANFGGRFVHFGKNIYANYNLTLTDDSHIYVGDDTLFGPNVTVVTATHPVHPELRNQGLQYNLPVHIGKGCWIGAGSTILPGVTIGDNVVIGAGSLVTKDIPSNVVAIGSPCKVYREITDKDKEEYRKGVKTPEEFL